MQTRNSIVAFDAIYCGKDTETDGVSGFYRNLYIFIQHSIVILFYLLGYLQRVGETCHLGLEYSKMCLSLTGQARIAVYQKRKCTWTVQKYASILYRDCISDSHIHVPDYYVNNVKNTIYREDEESGDQWVVKKTNKVIWGTVGL